MDNTVIFSFDEIWHFAYNLSKKIRESGFIPDLIIGISRGGLVVARLLSDMLSVTSVGIIGITFYKGINETKKNPIVTQKLSINIAKKNVLLVDDVSDRGSSLAFAMAYLKNKKAQKISTATLHFKPHSSYKPNFFIDEVSSWIVYPWEYCEYLENFITKQREKGFEKNTIKNSLMDYTFPEIIIDDILTRAFNI